MPHLNALAPAAQAAFLADVARLGQAVLEATGALRINYALFGNLEPALHAHVVPRYADEPEALRTAHPWAYDWAAAPRFDAAAHRGTGAGDQEPRGAGSFLEHHAVLHHERHALQHRHVAERVAVDRDQVGTLAGLERADLGPRGRAGPRR